MERNWRVFKRSAKNRNAGEKAKDGTSKIRIQLLVSFLIPILLMAVLGIISYNQSENAIKKNYEKSATDTMNAVKDYLNLGFKTVEEKSFDFLHNENLVSYYSENQQGISAMVSFFTGLKEDSIVVKESNPFIYAIHIIGESGNCHSTAGTPPKDLYKQFTESEEGKRLSTSTKRSEWVGIHDSLDKSLSVNQLKYGRELYAFSIIRKFNNNKGFLITDVSREEIIKTLSNINFGDGSLVSFISGDGRETTADSEKESVFIGLPYYEASVSGQIASGYSYEKYQEKSYLYLYSKVGETGAVLCALIPTATIVQKASDIKTTILIFVILASLVAVAIGLLISEGIGKAIKQLIHSIARVARGDLTTGFETKRKDEFQVLSESLLNMMKNIRHLIKGVQEVGSKVSDSSESISLAYQNILDDTRNISLTIEEIERGITQQASDAEHCVEQMSGLSEKINLLYDGTGEIQQISDRTKNTVIEGMVIVNELNSRSKETTNITLLIIKEIETLEKQIRSISEFVNVINGIASQTNLLSLNASIEAARAGEAGLGFAVVATEIRTLAEHSEEAASKIQSVVSDIKRNTSEMVESAKTAEGIVEIQSSALAKTVQVFESINSHVGDLISHLNTVTHGIQSIESAKEDTLNAICNISAVSQQTAVSAESVTGRASNQINSVEQLSLSINELAEDAHRLDEEIKIFKIN